MAQRNVARGNKRKARRQPGRADRNVMTGRAPQDEGVDGGSGNNDLSGTAGGSGNSLLSGGEGSGNPSKPA